MNKITVNDGRGLYDNEGICEKGILICNAALKDLVSGQYLSFVNKIEQIAQIFGNLKTGIKNDRESLEATIEELKRANNELVKMTGVPAEKEGV